MAMLVYSTGGKFEILPASAQAIVGEYVEDGENHGRKVYRRTHEVGKAEVLLFYWDARDGKDTCGWWFGDQIGGGQVWGRAAEATISPPMKGWRCPVDGPTIKHIVCVPKLRAKEEAVREPTQSIRTSGKRPAESSIDAGPATRSRQSETFVLASSLADKATKAVHKIVGEYEEHGENHGRKAFHRKPDNSGDREVWLYFWDQRDGWDCSGWWLGDSVGGAQVFARSTNQGSKPPHKGWRIPHDGVVKSDVTVTIKGSAEDKEMPGSERVEKVKQLMSGLEERTQKGLETARPVLHGKGELLEEGVTAVYVLLRSLMDSLMDAKGSIERHSKAVTKQDASEETEAELTLQEERLNGFAARIEAEMSTAKTELQRLELGNAEEKDSKTLEKALQVALEVVAQAEMAADSALTKKDIVEAQHRAQAALQTVSKTLNISRRYAPQAWKHVEADFTTLRDRCNMVEKGLASLEKSLAIGAAGESQRAAMQDVNAAAASLPTLFVAVEQAEEAVEAAVETASEHEGQLKCALPSKQAILETQAAANAAQESISIARGLTDGFARAAQQLATVEQITVLDEIASLRKRTAQAQKKLDPHKKARSEYYQKVKAKQDTDAFDVEMSAVEAEVERVAAIFSTAASEEAVKEAEEALPAILTSLSTKMQAVEDKATSATATSAGVFVAILERAKVVKDRVADMKNSSKDCRKKLKAKAILSEADAEVQKAEEWQERMSKAEQPWAGNVEVVAENVAKPALEACAKVAEQAEAKVKASKVKLMEKLVDVRQLPEGPLRFETAEALMKLQGKVEQIVIKVTQLKIDTYARKTKLLMPEVILAVSMAEENVRKVTEAAGPLEEDNLEKGGRPADEKAACKKIVELEKACTKECTSARAAVEAKKNDPKFAISPSFRTQLLRLEGRLDAAQKQVATLVEAAGSADKSKALFDARNKELQSLSALVEEMDLAALPLGDEEPTADSNNKTAELFESTRMRLGQWQSGAESLVATHAHGSLRLAMKRLVAQSVQLQSSLVESRATAGDRLNHACCIIFLREGKEQIDKAGAVMVKADQAEGPFLQGVEVLSLAQASKSIAQCEAAAATAQKVVDEVCMFFRVRCQEVSAYKKDSKSDVASFIELSKQASSLKTKLNQFRKDTEQRKAQAANA